MGFEAVASVKEKLKTVSEELEDFVEVSCAVDIDDDDDDHHGDDDDADDDGDDRSMEGWKPKGTE